jgi:hypothetical protein
MNGDFYELSQSLDFDQIALPVLDSNMDFAVHWGWKHSRLCKVMGDIFFDRSWLQNLWQIMSQDQNPSQGKLHAISRPSRSDFQWKLHSHNLIRRRVPYLATLWQ